MSYTKHLYYNFLAFNNNIILNWLLIANLIIPNYFNDQIIKYKLKGDEYYKFIIILTINDEIQNKYNIDMLTIGLQLYNKYKSLTTNDDNNDNNDDNDDNDNEITSNLSDISDISDISYLSDN